MSIGPQYVGPYRRKLYLLLKNEVTKSRYYRAYFGVMSEQCDKTNVLLDQMLILLVLWGYGMASVLVTLAASSTPLILT